MGEMADYYTDSFIDDYLEDYESRLLINTQDDGHKWRSRDYGYITPQQMSDGHLLNSIHLCERKVLNGKNYGEKYPTIYYRLIAEAVKRKIIPVVRAKRIVKTRKKK